MGYGFGISKFEFDLFVILRSVATKESHETD